MFATLPKRPSKRRIIHMDHAAATPLDPAVFQAMKPYLTMNFANPSALYEDAVTAKNAISIARKKIADILGTQSDTILFTGSGTESANMAIHGVCTEPSHTSNGSNPHILTTSVEHHAVFHPIQLLEKRGWKVTYLPVNAEGKIAIEEVRNGIQKETKLVSIMYANNEIGTIYPIAEIGRSILQWRKRHGTPYPLFHVDACQAAPYFDLHVERLHADLLTLNGSKLYGPKGTGILFKRRGITLEPIAQGGNQEFGLRPGTEHVAGIVGIAKALEMAQEKREEEKKRQMALRDDCWKRIQKKIPDAVLNGSKTARLPNNLHVTFRGADAEALILYLDACGIQCSAGSACTTDSDAVSHVLSAIGISASDAACSIRLTLGKTTTKADITALMRSLPKVVALVRKMSSYHTPWPRSPNQIVTEKI